MNPSLLIRKAHPDDVLRISTLIDPYVREEIVLPRSEEVILRDIDQTFVAQSSDGSIVGTLTAIFFSETLCELRALVVLKGEQGKGAGKLLVDHVLKDLQQNMPLDTLTVFALTYVPDFFLKIGFQVTDKEHFPQKIFDVCHFCPREDNCNEIAVEKVFIKNE